MIKLYTRRNCVSCRKAKKWLEEKNIIFQEVDLVRGKLSKEEILNILALTEEGIEEIISFRSNAFRQLIIGTCVDDYSMKTLFEVFQQNPEILRCPIITDGKCLQVGYNEDSIRQFIPSKMRQQELYEISFLSKIKK